MTPGHMSWCPSPAAPHGWEDGECQMAHDLGVAGTDGMATITVLAKPCSDGNATAWTGEVEVCDEADLDQLLEALEAFRPTLRAAHAEADCADENHPYQHDD